MSYYLYLGQAMGIRVLLQNGLIGFIHLKNMSDERFEDPQDRVQIGQTIHCRIIKINIERFSIGCSSKRSDLLDRNGKWQPKKDNYYDKDLEDEDYNFDFSADFPKKASSPISMQSTFNDESSATVAVLNATAQAENNLQNENEKNESLVTPQVAIRSSNQNIGESIMALKVSIEAEINGKLAELREKDVTIEELKNAGEKLSKQIRQQANIIEKLQAKEKEANSLLIKQNEQIETLESELE